MSVSTWFGINDAFAASTAGHMSASGVLSSLPMLLAFGVIFYFLLIRPQMKQQKQQKQLLSGLAVGDEVVTTGGLVGTIKEVDDQYVMVLTPSKTELTFQKRSIAQSLPKGGLDAPQNVEAKAIESKATSTTKKSKTKLAANKKIS